jgi:GT2 family glycosyltransferase
VQHARPTRGCAALISVILYGRNDAHGYNLHRRAALSLNCLAEGLTDRDDEIVFVDYNTPDELPTFIEAIADTLTERCLRLLRVLRVPAAVHRRRFAARTHLPALEPISRNAAVRRANPSNRWLLSTNTDMVFLPLVGESLSDICGDLADGFYGLPRFELPEWLWERLPRSDPRATLSALERLGAALRLDEPTVSHEWIRFDAPGDFQLILRDDFFAVDAFNEEMLLGYHVDSNLSRRMVLHRGSIETLGAKLAGYHCNHNRVPTVYHGARPVTNDLERFFYSVDEAELPQQRMTWGLPDADLEEVPIRARATLDVGDRVAAAVPANSRPRVASDALASAFGFTYDSGHILPFVADSVVVSSEDAQIGYIGANPILRQALVTLAIELGTKEPVLIADLDNLASVDKVALADVVVVDLGVDASLVDGSPTAPTDYDSVELPPGLDRAFAALDRFVELERRRLLGGDHPRRIVLVNSATAFWNAYVLAHLECSHTSVHSRVRRATVKPVPDADDASTTAIEFLRRQIRWSARRHAGDGRFHLCADTKIEIGALDDYSGFRTGWASPDPIGIWTQGERSELELAFDDSEFCGVLGVGIGGVCVEPDRALHVEVFLDGEPLGDREVRHDQWSVVLPSLRRPLSPRLIQTVKTILPESVTDRLYPLYWRWISVASPADVSHLQEILWRIDLPAEVTARGGGLLTFVIPDRRTPRGVGWSDDERELGIHLRSLGLERLDRALPEEKALFDSIGP